MAEMIQSQGNSLLQKQEQQLTPVQMQALHFLTAPVEELRSEIRQAAEKNPLLEIEESSPEDPEPELPSDRNETDRNSPSSGADGEADEEYERLRETAADNAYEENADIFLPPTADEEAEERREYLFNSLSSPVSLQEDLMEQLSFSGVSGKLREAAEYAIGGIDGNGYLRTHPADIAQSCSCTVEEAEKAIRLVQTFEPKGIGARNLEECLLLQLDPAEKEYELMKTVIERYLEDTAKNRLPKIASELGIPLEKLETVLTKIRRLDPRPGGQVDPGEVHYVIPEAAIVPDGDGFKVIPEGELPRLTVSETYLKMLEDPSASKEAKSFIREKLSAARSTITSLESREKTIFRLAKVIASEQYDFLKKGKEYLHPLTMQHAADMLGFNNSTISRAVAGKYVRTPQGVFEFKFFFSGGYSDTSGEAVSATGVREKIRNLAAKEDPAHPLSDSDITEQLKKEGLAVSRRTVAKYREEMGIPASHLRRKF